jgi:hypothetical protein
MKTKYKNSVRDSLMAYFKSEVGEIGLINLLQEKVEEQWPKKDDGYWLIDSTGDVDDTIWLNDEADQYRLKTNNVFKTESEAEARLKEVMEGK